jgi:pyruvate kinase
MAVYAFTPNAAVARQLAVIYGLHAIEAPKHASTDEMMSLMNRMLVEKGSVNPGEYVVFVAGQPIGIPGTTNLLKLHRIT